jgi:hypothetical protein
MCAFMQCILHDLDFNPENDKQAEDRCHRLVLLLHLLKLPYLTDIYSGSTTLYNIHLYCVTALYE